MTTLLLVIAVALLAVLASQRRLLEARRLLLAHLAASGLVFILLGVLCGPHGGALLSVPTLASFDPLVALSLGSAGLLLGLSLERSVLKALPFRAFAASFSQSLVTLVLVAGACMAVLWPTGRPDWSADLGGALLLAAAACLSSGHLALLWASSGRITMAQGRSVALLAFIDDFLGLFALAVALVFGTGASPAQGAMFLAEAIALGAVCALLFILLLEGPGRGAEATAILIGGVALVSGAAAYLRVSPLLSGFTAGALLVLFSRRKADGLYRTLSNLERPVYLVLLFLIGAHVNLRDAWAWMFLPAFVGVRFLGKLWGGRLARKIAGLRLSLPTPLGYALIAPGAVSLCILTGYLLLNGGAMAQRIFDLGVVAAVVNEVLAAATFGRAKADSKPLPTGIPSSGAPEAS